MAAKASDSKTKCEKTKPPFSLIEDLGACGDARLSTGESREIIPLQKDDGSFYPWSNFKMNPKKNYKFGAFIQRGVEEALEYLYELRSLDPLAYRKWFNRYNIYRESPHNTPFPMPPVINRHPYEEKFKMMKYLETYQKKDTAAYDAWYLKYKQHVYNPDKYAFPLIPGFHFNCPEIKPHKKDIKIEQ